MDDTSDNANRTGARDSPFNKYQEVRDWLSGLSPTAGCTATLLMVPGIYTGENLAIKVPLTVMKCLDCPGPSYAAGEVTVVTSELNENLFQIWTPVTIKNVTFYGYESDSYPQWRREVSDKLRRRRDASGSVFSSSLDSEYDIDLSAFESPSPKAPRYSSLFFLIQGSLVLDRVDFSRHHRQRAIIESYGANLTIHDTTAILNYRSPDADTLTSGVLISSFETAISISDSHFLRNQLILRGNVPRSSGGGVLNSESGTINITRTDFVMNLVVFEGRTTKDWVSICGGAVRIAFQVTVTSISDSKFKSNSLTDFTNTLFMVGGAICIPQSGFITIVDTEFLDNLADIGGAVGQVPPEFRSSPLAVFSSAIDPDPTEDIDYAEMNASSFKTFFLNDTLAQSTTASKDLFVVSKLSGYRSLSLHLKRVVARENTCYIRGCAFSLDPVSQTVEWLIEDSIISKNNFIANSTKLCPEFTNPILQLADRREVSGGSGISFFVRNIIPYHTSLVLNNVTMQQNEVKNWQSCALGGGAAISSFGVETVTISNSLILDHSWSGEMTGIIWAREFKLFNMINSNMSNNWIHNPLTPISPILDLQSDVIYPLSATNYSVILQNCSFDRNTASQTIYIADVSNALLSDISIRDAFRPIPPTASATMKSCMLISTVRHRLVIDGMSSIAPTLPHRISSVSQLQILNSQFHGYDNGFIEIPFHLSLDSINRAMISNTTFRENQSGALHVSSVQIEINNCQFTDNMCFGDGCAVRASTGTIWMTGSYFESNHATNGGSIAFIGGDAFIVQTTFNRSFALHGKGGAIYASQASILLQDIVCTDNRALEGGCIGMDATLLKTDHSRHWMLSMSSSVLTRNNARKSGGAVSVSDNIDMEIFGARMSHNTAEQGGGGAVHFAGGHLFATNLECYNNFAGNVVDMPPIDPEAPPERQTIPTANLLDINTPSGGAFQLNEASVTMVHSVFDTNWATGRAGAISFLRLQRAVELKNVTFSKNQAHVAGAISFDCRSLEIYHAAKLTNVSFIENLAAYGGALEWSVVDLRHPLEIQHFRDHSLENPISLPKPLPPPVPFMLVTNSSFIRNLAIGSGGAIYTGARAYQYFDYHDLSFVDNTAYFSGGTFFWHPSSRKRDPPPFCLPSNCTISVNASGNVTPPLWGPILASGLWDLVPIGLVDVRSNNSLLHPNQLGNRFDRTGISAAGTETLNDEFPETSSGWPLTVSTHYGEYLLKLGYEDSYGQHVTESDFSLTSVFLGSNCDSRELVCPVIQIIDGTDSFRILIFANETQKLDLGSYQPNSKPSPILTPVSISVKFRVRARPNYDFALDNENEISLQLSVSKCQVGSGLQTSSLRGLAMCDKCPINSYNYDGDGQCYLCNNWRETATAQLTCVGSTVSFMEDYWATTIRGSNALFVGRCPLGFCERGQCAQGRTGTLCGACDPGTFESLFAFCSASLCKSPNILFFILVCFLLACFATALHAFLLRWPAMTMFILYCLQMALMLIQYPLDWAIPRSTPFLAGILCGFLTGPLTRTVFSTFVPYACLVFLWVPWLVLQPLRLMNSRIQASTRNGSWFDVRRLTMTTFAIFFAQSSHTLKLTVDWFQCHNTPLGNIWMPGPSVKCSEPEFTTMRLWAVLIGLPVAVGPLIASLVFLVTAKALPKWQIRMHWTFRVSSRTRQLFHFLQTSSPYWPAAEILSRVFVPVILAYAPSKEVLTSSTLGVFFALMVVMSIPFSPFLLPLQRHSASVAVGLLGVLGLFRVDLIYGKNPIAPMLTCLFVCLFLFAFTLVLIIGKPALETKTLSLEGFEDFSIENAWEREIARSDNEEESKSLLSFRSEDMESDVDTAAEELDTDNDSIDE
jgi:predicted outer membrane repeat protein